MHRVEFRIEHVPINRDGPPTLLLVERLAELGRQGWHVAAADLTPHPPEGRVTVLLERELDDEVPFAEPGVDSPHRSVVVDDS